MKIISEVKGLKGNVNMSKHVADFIEYGCPQEWEDSGEMQESLTLQEKGWCVQVKWDKQFVGDVCIGVGLYADQDIAAGTILRQNKLGYNLIIFNETTNLPNLKHKRTAEYLQKYAHRCPCLVDAGSMAMALLLPGDSLNHSEEPNTRTRCHKDGSHLIATRDIKKGEPMSISYRAYGPAPEWFTDMLDDKLGNSEAIFPGTNDYL